jgi:hypothetical protein
MTDPGSKKRVNKKKKIKKKKKKSKQHSTGHLRSRGKKHCTAMMVIVLSTRFFQGMALKHPLDQSVSIFASGISIHTLSRPNSSNPLNTSG